jgi:hypothetical protein
MNDTSYIKIVLAVLAGLLLGIVIVIINDFYVRESRLKDLGYYKMDFKDNEYKCRDGVYVVENGKTISLKQFLEYMKGGKTREELKIRGFKFWGRS